MHDLLTVAPATADGIQVIVSVAPLLVIMVLIFEDPIIANPSKSGMTMLSV